MGVKHTAEHCANTSKALLGVTHTDERCANKSKAALGVKRVKYTAEGRANMRKATLGVSKPNRFGVKLSVINIASIRKAKDASFYDNVSKLKSLQQEHGHCPKLGDDAALAKFSYGVRRARSIEGEYRGKFFLDKSLIEALDAFGFYWTIKHRVRRWKKAASKL